MELQASILFLPLLFKICMKPLTESICNSVTGCHQYASTVFYYRSLQMYPFCFQICSQAVVRCLRHNNLKLNPDKTEVTLVWKADIQEELDLLVLVGVRLAYWAQIKSLGLLMDPTLFSGKQVEAIARFLLYPLI